MFEKTINLFWNCLVSNINHNTNLGIITEQKTSDNNFPKPKNCLCQRYDDIEPGDYPYKHIYGRLYGKPDTPLKIIKNIC